MKFRVFLSSCVRSELWYFMGGGECVFPRSVGMCDRCKGFVVTLCPIRLFTVHFSFCNTTFFVSDHFFQIFFSPFSEVFTEFSLQWLNNFKFSKSTFLNLVKSM